MAVMSWRPSFTRYDIHGAFLGRIIPRSALWEEALDGTDTLTLICEGDLAKGDRVVWMDARGRWHEHLVDSARRLHDAQGAPLTTATCLNSLCETWDDWVDDKRPSGTVDIALTSALLSSRWAPGNSDQPGSNSATFYHCSVREAIATIQEVWGGELETTVTVGPAGVTSRSLAIRAKRGDQHSKKRFTWTKDLVSVERTVASENPKSRIYCYGKGEETESGGYGRRISIGSVNHGLDFVEDKAAEAVWGRPGPGGTRLPAIGVYVNEECEDPSQLKAEGLAYLEQSKDPQVTYTANVVDLARFGRPWEDVGLGDRVTICDKGFSEAGVVLQGRISALKRDLLSGECEVTFGTLQEIMADAWASTIGRLSSISKQAMGWNAASGASPGWLEVLIGNLNAAYDAAGTYHYSSFEQGEIWSNVPLDENGRATKPGGWAMNINGLGFRLASGTKADGSWNWRAFGNGNGFTATEINAGTLNANLVKAGTLTDASGKNFWNMTTGEFSLASTATVGGKTVSGHINDFSNTLTQQNVFNRLTNNGKTQGIYLNNGLLYINASYMKAGIITDGVGRNSWDLTTGAFITNNMTANNAKVNGTFSCGTAAQLLTVSNGMIFGTENGDNIGYIDYSAHSVNLSTGAQLRGIQMQAQGSLRLSVPQVSIAASSNVGTTATICPEGTFTQPVLVKAESGANGTITWYNGTLKFLNGLFTAGTK